MPLPIKRAGKRDWRFFKFTRLSNRRPLIAAGRHGIVVQLDIRRQRKILVRIAFTRIDLLCQICQFRTVADLVGIRLRTSTTSKLFRNIADPHIRAILIIQQRDVVLTVILVLGGLLVLVFLVLLIPIGGLVLLILIGLVGVVALTLAGVLVLITGVGRLFIPAVLGVLVFVVLALVVPAGVDISRVRVALDDGRTAAAHHLRGKGRGGHQRQREHHAHQQAHDAPRHIACPFLHVICSSLC